MKIHLSDIFRKKKKERYGLATEAELEHITSCLIQEATCDLRKHFQKELQNQVANGNSIEKTFAERILKSLIVEAVAKRKMLIGRIEKDVETGDLFDRYYGKMHTINILTNSAYASMQRMDVAEERYIYEKMVYKKITGKMYEPEAIPDDTLIKKARTKKRDILEVMDERKRSIEDGDGE